MPIHLPHGGSTENASEAEKMFAAARDYYADRDTLARIAFVMTEARRFIQANNRKTIKKTGEIDENNPAPWLPAMTMTDCPKKIELRRTKLRGIAFGQGMRYALNQMVEREVLAPPARKFFVEATDYTSNAFFNEMIEQTLWRAPPINMTQACDIFDIDDPSHAANLRDHRLVRLATFGFTTVKRPPNRWSIGPGPVALAFYETVFVHALGMIEKAVHGTLPPKKGGFDA